MKWWVILFHFGIVFLIILLAVSPMIPVAVAGTIAEINGCTLHEGFANPCVVNGRDLGETLYAMGMMGWLAIATLPLGLAALAVYLFGVVGYYFVRWIMRRRRSQAGAV
jgi:hypothetical protein